jgi:penicillin-binding protein 1C
VQAYRVLARGGRLSPLNLRQTDEPGLDRIVLPADATYIVADILSDRAARSLTFGLDNHLNTAFWSAVKTGTSKGLRDNWCIGFSSRFTVGVWVGNFEGDSMHDVSGVSGAAPVWGEIMAALHANIASQPPLAPATLTRAEVDFTPAVEPRRGEWFLAGTEMQRIAALSAGSAAPAISNPANGMVIAVDPDIPEARQKVPFSARGADHGMTFRLNGATLGPASQGLLWSPTPGAHRLELVGPAGRVEDRISFVVR